MKKIIIMFLFLAPGPFLSSQEILKSPLGYELHRIGAPVKSLAYLNFALAEPDKGIESDILINTYGMKESYFVRYSHINDKVTLHPIITSKALWGVTNYDKNKVFFGGCITSQIYEYDVNKDKVTELLLPDKNNTSGLVLGEEYIWCLSSAPDGKIYGGTYPNGKVFSYNPKTRVTIDYGTMIEGEQYARYICSDFPGKIFAGIGSHAGLIELDLQTKMKRQILPKQFKKQAFVYHLVRFKNYLVALLSPDPIILIFDVESRNLIKSFDLKEYDPVFYAQKMVVSGNKLYFGMSPHDNLFSIDYNSLKVSTECRDIGGPIGLAQDRYLFCLTGLKKFSIYDIVEKKVVKTFVKNIEGNQAVNIFAMNNGPDGKVYGGVFINQHLFSFDPENNTMKDLGLSINRGGQINAMISFKDKLYIGHYIEATLSVYEPAKSWNPGLSEESNPRLLGMVGDEQDRIYDMDTEGKDNIYLATYPGYGKLGGCLTIYNPEKGNMENYRNVINNQSIRSLKVLNDGLIVIGSDILGGIGQKSTEVAAKLLIWDPKIKSKADEITPIEKSRIIFHIVQGKDERIYSCVDSTFFIYDYKNKKIDLIKQPGWGNITRLLPASDGFIYGIAKRAIFRYDPRKNEFAELFPFDAEDWMNFIIEDKKSRIFIGSREYIYRLVKIN